MALIDQFTLNDLLSLIDPATLARGMDCFKRHQVQQVVLVEDSGQHAVLGGVTRGSGERLYLQAITLERRPGSERIRLHGDCDCPVGEDCKHVAAACLQLLDMRQRGRPIPRAGAETTDGPDRLAPMLDWLGRLDAAAPAGPAALPEHTPFVAYVLQTEGNGNCTLELRETRLGPSGRLNKGRKIGPGYLYSWRAASRLTDQDRLIGDLLDLLPQGHGGGPRLSGRLGFVCLQHVIDSGRCFYQDTSQGPLHRAEALRTEALWIPQDGDLRLYPELPPDTQIIASEPPMYLDQQALRVGELQIEGFQPAQATLLLQAPSLPGDLAERLTEHMLQHFPATPLPTPKQVEQRDLGRLSPIPCLTLHKDFCLSLHFDYAGHPVNPENSAQPLLIREQGELLRIQRDLDKEAQIIETLEQEGLVPATANRVAHAMTWEDGDAADGESSVPFWVYLVDELVPQLENEGWRIAYDDYAFRVDHADDLALRIEQDENAWFSVGFDLRLDGKTYPLMPLIAWIIEQSGEHLELDRLPERITYSLSNQHHVRVPLAPLRPVIENLLELFEQHPLNADGELELSLFDAPRLARTAEASGGQLDLSGADAVLEFGRRLDDFQGIAEVPAPAGLQAQLRAYQQTGVNWLQFLREYGLGGILADDMGLGKTLQTLTHILVEKEAGRLDRPVLIVAPTSLMGNWRREAERFTPALRVLVLQGHQRKSHFKQIPKHDLVLTTYPLLPRDGKLLRRHAWHSLILDEAQLVKNTRSKAAQAIRAFDAKHRLCLTGTPMENHLGELWSQFDFLLPGFLGDSKTFTQVYRTPIEKHGDLHRRTHLQQRIAPFMLRRTKDQVAAELPPKTEILRSVAFDDAQAMLYESIRLSMEQRVRDAVAAKGLASSQITILDALLKLRQVCCDPRLLAQQKPDRNLRSAKLEMLMQLLPEQLAEGRRILLFSQFTSMLKLIEQALQEQDIGYTKLTGQTRKREQAIERFSSGEVQLFLISLKAGGVGLNLTEADTVIHYDPWWNPAAEAQATDRAHRIGQDKPVFVYKLIVENTVEEKIIAMQERKRALAEGIYGEGPADGQPSLNAEDLQYLFEPIPRD